MIGALPLLGTSHAAVSVNSLGRSVSGPQRLLVIATEFADIKHSPTKDLDYIRKIVFGTVNDYYTEASYNQTWLVGKVTDRWYTLSKNASFYELKRMPQCQERNWGPMINEAVNLASNHENLAAYRYFIVVHPANGDMWQINCGLGDNTFTIPLAGMVTLRGVLIHIDAWPSVWAHELGHSMGDLPDMYEVTDNRPDGTGFVGPWDLMSDTGFRTPQHFSVWSKIKMGWIPSSAVITASRGRTINATIDPLELPSSQTYALKIPLGNAYYLAEVRQSIGFDSVLPDYGLVIYFVDESKDEWGQSPIIVQRTENESTLTDATFDYCAGKQIGFFDEKNDVSIVITGTRGLSYEVFAGSVKRGRIALAESESHVNKSCYLSQPSTDPTGDLFDEGFQLTHAESYVDIVSTDIKKSDDAYLFDMSLGGSLPKAIDHTLWIEWDIAIDIDNNPATGWNWTQGYNDIGVDYVIRTGIQDSTYYPQIMKTEPKWTQTSTPLCTVVDNRILFTIHPSMLSLPSTFNWVVTAQKYGNRGEPPNPPLLVADKAPNTRHFMTQLASIETITTTTSLVSSATTKTTMPTTGQIQGILLSSFPQLYWILLAAAAILGVSMIVVMRLRRRKTTPTSHETAL